MLIFDGDCGFCTTAAGWVSARLSDDHRVVPWQAIDDLSIHGLTEADVTTASYWVDEAGTAYRGSAGIAEALKEMPGALSYAGQAMTMAPVSWIAAGVYKLVVKYRHQLPGATDACRVEL